AVPRSGSFGRRRPFHPAGDQLHDARPGRLPLLSRGRFGDPDHFGGEGEQAGSAHILEMKEANMREHYDFETMKGLKNPYAARLKQPISIRLDKGTIAYFKGMAADLGM